MVFTLTDFVSYSLQRWRTFDAMAFQWKVKQLCGLWNHGYNWLLFCIRTRLNCVFTSDEGSNSRIPKIPQISISNFDFPVLRTNDNSIFRVNIFIFEYYCECLLRMSSLPMLSVRVAHTFPLLIRKTEIIVLFIAIDYLLIHYARLSRFHRSSRINENRSITMLWHGIGQTSIKCSRKYTRILNLTAPKREWTKQTAKIHSTESKNERIIFIRNIWFNN